MADLSSSTAVRPPRAARSVSLALAVLVAAGFAAAVYRFDFFTVPAARAAWLTTAAALTAVLAVPMVFIERAARWTAGRFFAASVLKTIALLLAISLLSAEANRRWDAGPARTVVVAVLGKQRVQGRPGAGRLLVESWHGSGVTVVPSPPRVFDAVVPGEAQVEIDLMPGRFGFEWIRAIRVAAPTSEVG